MDSANKGQTNMAWISMKMFEFFTKLSFVFSLSSIPKMSNPPTESTESFASLLLSDLCTNTNAFLTVYRDGISQSPDRLAALARFQVTYMTINKSKREVFEHELISAKVFDNQKKKTYDFFIKRNASKRRPHLALPVTHPKLYTSIDCTVGSVTQVVGDPGPTSGQPTATSEYHPLIPLDETPHLPSTSIPQFNTSHCSQHSLLKKITLGSTEALYSSITSLDCIAEDRILGRGKFVTDDYQIGGLREGGKPIQEIGLVIRQLQPIDLSLYELGILVDVIHKEAPEYSLLRNQCYWFTNTSLRYTVIN
jgi:hypothetical protein